MAMHVHNCEDGRVGVGGEGVVEEVSGFKQRPFFFFFLRGTISAKRAQLSCPPTIIATWLSRGHPGSPSLPHMEAANICFLFVCFLGGQ